MKRPRHTPFLIVAIGCFLIIGISVFPSTGRDDSHITYWAAHALADLGEIVNHSGDRVEQSSSLLLVGILAVVHRIVPIPITELGWLSSVLFGVAALWISARFARALKLQVGEYVPLLVGTSPYFIYWSFSGMETSLAAVVSLYFLISCTAFLQAGHGAGRWRPAHMVVSTCLYMLCRPESGLVAGVWLVALFSVHLLRRRGSDAGGSGVGFSLKPLAVVSAVVVVTVSAIAALRFAYFGAVAPNPVFAKLGASLLVTPTNGLRYLAWHSLHPAVAVPSLVTCVGVGLVLARTFAGRTSRAFVLSSLSLYLAAYLLVIVSSGGDWMEGGRFLVPIVPVGALLVAGAIEPFRVAFRRRVVGVLLVTQLLGISIAVVTFSRSRPLWTYTDTVARYPVAREYGISEIMNNVHLRDAPLSSAMVEIVGIVQQEKAGKVNILSEYGGMVIYHVARNHFPDLRFVDRFGVTSRDIFRCSRFPDFHKISEGVMTPFAELIGPGESCGLSEIDIVFTHGRETSELQSHGYLPVYRQSGQLNAGSPWSGAPVSGEMVIAVSRRYGDAVRRRLKRTVFDWGETTP